MLYSLCHVGAERIESSNSLKLASSMHEDQGQSVDAALARRHYHALTRPFEAPNAHVALYHMACVVDETTRDVTFLFKFERGASSKSHGVNVARLAGLPSCVLAQVCAACPSHFAHTHTSDLGLHCELDGSV